MLDQSTFPIYSITLIDSKAQITPILEEAAELSVEQLSDIIGKILFDNSHHIIEQLLTSKDKTNWVGFSMGKHWGKNPLDQLWEIISRTNIQCSRSISQTGGERNKRIMSLGFKF